MKCYICNQTTPRYTKEEEGWKCEAWVCDLHHQLIRAANMDFDWLELADEKHPAYEWTEVK